MSVEPDQKIPLNIREFGSHPLSLRLWHGMTLSAWLRATRGNWGRISPRRYPLALTITLFSLTNQLLAWLCQAIYGRRLAQVEIDPHPIFIIGYWRSGTTWLHDIMTSGPTAVGPARGACFSPEFFLLTEKLFSPLLQKMTSEKRPMDNVSLDLKAAEEDEVAIALSGAVSHFRGMMFPSDPTIKLVPAPGEIPAKAIAHRRRVWLNFLRRIQFAHPGKQLVLKSPPHSLWIEEILKDFPNARFIHIKRDPYSVLKSGAHTAKAMTAVSALEDHMPADRLNMHTQIDSYAAFHERMEAGKALIPANHLTEITYEDLRADPVAVVRGVYDALGLENFAEVEPELQAKAEAAKSYQNNAYTYEADFVAAVDARCKPYFDLYGYLPMAKRTAPPS